MCRPLVIVLTSITITALIITDSSNAYAEPEKTYYYSDGYGYHEIPYDLKYGEITNLDCNNGKLTLQINAERKDEIELYVPVTLLDTRGANIIDITMRIKTASGLWDYHREQLDDSLKLTFKVVEGHSQARIQTENLLRDCKIAPPEGNHYMLNSPKSQSENGIPPHKVICKKDRNPMFRILDQSTICVKPETKKTLTERGHYDEIVWIRIEMHCHEGCNIPSWIDLQSRKNSESPFMTYLKDKNIEILDAKTKCSGLGCFCEFGCPYVMEYSFQIFKKDFEKIDKDGFEIVTIPNNSNLKSK